MIRPSQLQPLLRPGPEAASAARKTGAAAQPTHSFQQLLDSMAAPQAAPSLRFSAHAQQRLAERSISLNPDTLAALEQAVQTLSAKGARDSVVYTGDAALVVSVENKTVVTALSANEAQGNVFTNIDSVMVLPQQAAPKNAINGQDSAWRGPGAADRLTRRNNLEV